MKFINVTREEYRQFKRAKEYNEAKPGELGSWCVQALGLDAWRAIQGGDCYLRRVRQTRLPLSDMPRIQEVSQEELEEMLREEQEADE